MGDERSDVNADRKLTVFCISLDDTSSRWSRTQELFGALPFVHLVRVPGVAGNTIPRTAAVHLAMHKRVQGGVMGCFLAHVAAWERVAASPERALIIEDDVELVAFERLLSLEIPDDLDLVFVNAGMAQRPKGVGALRLLPIRSILPIKAAMSPTQAGVGAGGYGYLLTPRGADKLLRAVRRDGFFGHVDDRLLRYALRQRDVFQNEALAGTWLVSSGKYLNEPPRGWNVIRARRLNVPVVVHRRGERSLRKSLALSGERSPSS